MDLIDRLRTYASTRKGELAELITEAADALERQTCDDAVSRQQAIDAVRKCSVKEVTPAFMLVDKAEVMTELMMLPSAQPKLATDYISKQSVIDAITDENIIRNMDSVMDSEIHRVKRSVHRIIASIPSPEPEKRTEERTETHACDCISRKEAIDALHIRFRDGFEEDKWWNSTHVLAALEDVPSAQPEYTEQDMREQFNAGYACGMHAAQPEIVRCKDCKWYDLAHPYSTVIADAFHCKINDRFYEASHFCGYGKRRE